jgi:hypothetical protein
MNEVSVTIPGQNQAALILDRHVLKPTKAGYECRIRKLKEYISTNHPNGIDSIGNIVLPIDVNVVMSFMGQECVISNVGVANEENQLVKAESTVGGYRSAIKYLYTINKKKMSDELVTALSTFCQGESLHH